MKRNRKFFASVIFVFAVAAAFAGIGIRELGIGEHGRERTEEKASKVAFVECGEKNPVIRLDMGDATMAEAIHKSEEEYIEESDCIVKGEVQEIQYCEYLGTPWRRLSVRVRDVIKGNVRKGEVLAVYLIGGYLSSKEYYSYYLDEKVPAGKEDTLYQMEMRPQESIAEEDDTEIYLLKRASKESPFESSAYESVGGYEMEYLYDEQRREYKQYREGGKEKYWKEEGLYRKLDK